MNAEFYKQLEKMVNDSVEALYAGLYSVQVEIDNTEKVKAELKERDEYIDGLNRIILIQKKEIERLESKEKYFDIMLRKNNEPSAALYAKQLYQDYKKGTLKL